MKPSHKIDGSRSSYSTSTGILRRISPTDQLSCFWQRTIPRHFLVSHSGNLPWHSYPHCIKKNWLWKFIYFSSVPDSRSNFFYLDLDLTVSCGWHSHFYFVLSISFSFFFHIKLICFFPSNWYVKLWKKINEKLMHCYMGLMDKLDYFQWKLFSIS